MDSTRAAQFQGAPQGGGRPYSAAPGDYYQQAYSQQSSSLQQDGGQQYSPPHPESYSQNNRQDPYAAGAAQYDGQSYGQQQTRGDSGNYYSPGIDHAQNYTPSVAAHQPAAQAPWDPQTMSPYADPDYDPNAPVDPNAPEGERTLRHAVIGGTTGYIVGHKTGHGGIGAVIGAVAGDFLSDKRHELKHHIREDWGNPSDQQSSKPPESSSGHSSHNSSSHNSGHHHHSRY